MPPAVFSDDTPEAFPDRVGGFDFAEFDGEAADCVGRGLDATSSMPIRCKNALTCTGTSYLGNDANRFFSEVVDDRRLRNEGSVYERRLSDCSTSFDKLN